MKTYPENSIYFYIETDKKLKEFNKFDFLNNYFKNDNENHKNKENNINNLINAITNHSIDNLLNDIAEGGDDITIYEEDIKYQISSTLNQETKEYKNISNIKLGKCEEKLKEKYNISLNESLLILKIDFKVQELSGPLVEYLVFHPETKEKLDLNYCEKDSINISLPVELNSSNIFKFNPNDEFYNDICSTFTTDNKTDITLNDRQEEFIHNNMSLCETDCIYKDYDYINKKVICECNVKINFANIYEINVYTEKFKKNCKAVNLVNLKIMKCYKNLFTKEGIVSNIGSYVILSIILLYIISLILFIFIGYNSLKKRIKDLVNFEKKFSVKVKINTQITETDKNNKKEKNSKGLEKNKKDKNNKNSKNRKKDYIKNNSSLNSGKGKKYKKQLNNRRNRFNSVINIEQNSKHSNSKLQLKNNISKLSVNYGNNANTLILINANILYNI